MRILAIRGRNLASLAGDFAVELAAPPLAQAGLFAITGPTGAGKSTLLDALCLALYDEMPRLAGAPKVAVVPGADADERLNADDVRGILRRGCTEACAEVDFLGHDRRRYRARWELRRARGKADGRTQNQTLVLTDLDTQQRLGGTKTETLAEIRARLGLSFEQFRRSALLAQGDFASFLRARAQERAELLERITGTQLYGELSIAAHRRARDEEDALRELEQGLAALEPLDESARAELLAGHARQAEALAVLEARHLALRRLADWQTRSRTLAVELAEADRALQQARAAVDAAGPRQQVWQGIRAAQPLRPVVEAVERTRTAAEAASQQLAGACQALADADAGLRQAQAEAQAAGERHAAAEGARLQAAPQLARAHALDARLADATLHRDTAVRLATGAEQAAEDAQQTLAGLQQQIGRSEAAQAEAEGWLAAHAGLDALAGQWPRWDAAFRQLLDRLREHEDARRLQAQAAHEQTTAAAALADAEQLREQARAARLQAEAEAGRLAAALAAIDADGLAARRRALAVRREALQPLPAMVERAGVLATQAQALVARIDDWRTREQQLGSALDAAETALPALRARAEEAELAARRAALAAAADVGHLRAQLEDGAPCPVCGSGEHPWARALPALDRLCGETRRHADSLREQCEAAAASASMRQLQRTEARTRLAEAQAEAGRLAADRAELQARWQQRPAGENLPGDLLQPGLADALASRLAALKVDVDALEAQEAEARRLAQTARQAQQALTEARAAQETAEAGLTRCRGETERIERLGADAQAAGERAACAAEALYAELAAPCSGLPAAAARLQQAPAALHAEAAAAVAQWQDAEQRRAAAVAGGAALAPRRAAAEVEAARAAEAAERAVQTATEAAAVLAGLHADRAGLFDGQPTAHVEAALAQAIGQAVAGRDAAQAAVSRASDVRNRAAGQEQAARSARERAGADAAEATRALNDALAEAGLDATEARHRLGFGERWLSDEGAALDALTAALREAGVRHDERRAQAEAHATARPPLPAADEGDAPSCPPSSDAPEAQLAGAETALRDARTALADLAARLRADDQRRSEGAERRTALAARRLQAAPWLALKELIGSADGSKFRGFAQSLTLEALVAHANAHLQELARRYRLRRVPGAGLELMVVDRDMADEVRGVHSLSGGETFLVSLALALGLASLSSNRVQVETLLIDEGFGTLDPDTLDIAVAALDALQGQGRQVGVISHVPALVERIGVQVRVRALGGGRSRIETVTGG